MILTQQTIRAFQIIVFTLLSFVNLNAQTHINTSKGRIESIDLEGNTLLTVAEFDNSFFLGITDEYMMIEPMDQNEKIEQLEDQYHIQSTKTSEDTSLFSFKAKSALKGSAVSCQVQEKEVSIDTTDASGAPIRIVFYIDDYFTE